MEFYSMPMKNVFDDARRRNLAKWLPKHQIEAALERLGEPPKAARIRCEAHARTTGKPCRAHALANGRANFMEDVERSKDCGWPRAYLRSAKSAMGEMACRARRSQSSGQIGPKPRLSRFVGLI